MAKFIDSKGAEHSVIITMEARMRVEFVATQARLHLAGHGAKEIDYAVSFNDVLEKVKRGCIAEIVWVIQAITDDGKISPEDAHYILSNDQKTWINAFMEATKEAANPPEEAVAPLTSSEDGAPLDISQQNSGNAKSGKSRRR